jgi:adenine-specific DNA-methyltransferase
MSTQRLELTWIGKNHPDYDIANIEPRILIEDPEKSYGDPTSENMLIHGDNLLALKALLPEYEGKVKCIYIDPPYNTWNTGWIYDDSVEHSLWLSLMKPRLELLRELLSDDGSIWISIDDDETHYLKVLCDEVFGRKNFVANVIWEKKYSPQNDAKWLSDSHDHILVYAKNKDLWRPYLMPRTEEMNGRYKNPDNDPRWDWKSWDVLVKTFSESGVFSITNPNTGEEFLPPKGSCYRFSKDSAETYLLENRFYFGKDGKWWPQLKRFLSDVKNGMVSKTIWYRTEVWDNQEAKKEVKEFGDIIFNTPKPERLIEKIAFLASKEWDIILDSFLWSGTTAAVAHKMGRRWIGIEMGDHAYTHCKVRLDKVIDGEDQWGITKSVDWKWGGGYKFYELAPSFITTDEFGNRVIDEFYDDAKLVRAMCKLLGYTFSPSDTEYYKQGVGTGRNYLYITTQMMSAGVIRQIASHLASDDSLTIATRKYESGAESADSRITIKKIPQSVLKACQYGKKEYLLPIRESAIEEVDWEDEEECIIS